jgi:hypothetical protein
MKKLKWHENTSETPLPEEGFFLAIFRNWSGDKSKLIIAPVFYSKEEECFETTSKIKDIPLDGFVNATICYWAIPEIPNEFVREQQRRLDLINRHDRVMKNESNPPK